MNINLDEIDIEQLISYEGYEYRLSSGNSGLQINVKTCPNCASDDWKVYFNFDNGLGNCFKCNLKFNKIKFVKYARNFPDYSAVFSYLRRMGDNVRYRPRTAPVASTKIVVNKDWNLPLNKKIEKEEEIPPYLKARFIDLKLIERFDLRICENGFYVYKNYNGKQAAVDFSRRVIIPIKDIMGNVVTFQGRDITGTSDKKYLFPNLMPASGSFIYNADYALENNFKKIVLNEGVFDVFATTQALESDIRFHDWCACGTFGKHFGIDRYNMAQTDQLKDLFRLRENGLAEVVILWDGEPAARLAAIEAALKLKDYGFNVRVGFLPENKDPAEVSKEVVLDAILNSKTVSKLTLAKYRISNGL